MAGPRRLKPEYKSWPDVQLASLRQVRKEALSIRDAFIKRINDMDLPYNPLDAIIDALGGPPKVAEMTGRKVSAVRKGHGGARGACMAGEACNRVWTWMWM